jgi:hypothetical protein
LGGAAGRGHLAAGHHHLGESFLALVLYVGAFVTLFWAG